MGRLAQKLIPCSSKKQKKRDIHAQDRISELPDEVLISILSRMTMKEAAKTSAFSRRWEKLWTFHPRLDFDGSKTLLKFQQQIMILEADNYMVKKLLDSERVGYINWVNHIVESCHIPTSVIDEFRVRFDLNESHKHDIDKWVRFAFEKKVKRFELNLLGYHGFIQNNDHYYPLCLQTLSTSISLTSLILKQVNVSGEVLQIFISNSPFLEFLCVEGSRSLVHLRVAGPSLYLKYLEIIHCECLKSLEIDAANLLSLKYSGTRIKIPFMNIPKVTELCIGGMCLPHFTHKFHRMSTFFSQLQKLAFKMVNIEKWMKKREFPILSHLKDLELTLFARDHDSLLFFSSWINACPLLNRFSLELIRLKSNEKRDVRKAKKVPHHSLKVVEITGFVGQTVDTEFCMYLIENAIMLEKIIIDPCCPTTKGSANENRDKERVKSARESAEQLKSKYFLGDKLVFCYSNN